jgi:hypothetical protein
LKTTWDAATRTVDATYTTGPDTLHCLYKPGYSGGAPTTQGFSLREVNGHWPYLAPGIDRDSTLTQQGTSGLLTKNGAQLRCEPAHMAYLQTEPQSGTYAGFNPFSDPAYWELSASDGLQVRADGRLGMARITVVPGRNTVEVAYGVKDADKARPDLAHYLAIFGAKAAPAVTLNDAPATTFKIEVEGQAVYLVALAAGTPAAKPDAAAEVQRLASSAAALDAMFKPDAADTASRVAAAKAPSSSGGG